MPLFGIPADYFKEAHTLVEDVWGNQTFEIRERLLEQVDLKKQLDLFEVVLANRLPKISGMHPAIAHALGRFLNTTDIGRVVNETGYSHRRFNQLFKRTVGVSPKKYCRILRFKNVLAKISTLEKVSLIDLALDAGYSDQAHFTRQFREFSGISPTEYLSLCVKSPHHVPIIQ